MLGGVCVSSGMYAVVVIGIADFDMACFGVVGSPMVGDTEVEFVICWFEIGIGVALFGMLLRILPAWFGILGSTYGIILIMALVGP